jgi:predicted metal-dependent phosphoesterase TrpH
MKNTDLHTHSYYSDGGMSPKELVRLAKKMGIRNLALTDHNTTKGFREAMKEGNKVGVNVIPGVEIRTDKGEILGYFIDINNKELNKELARIRKKVQEKIKKTCYNLNKAGYNISFNEIWKKFLKARGNINEFYPLFLLHLKGYGTTLEIAKEIRKKKLKKVRIKEISVIKAIKLINNAGGKAVIAHPWIDKEILFEKNLKEYVKAGLRGIEINNGDREPIRNNKIVNRIKNLAKRYNLILTSGSDYHGLKLVKQMPGNHDLGKNNCDEKVIKQLELLTEN